MRRSIIAGVMLCASSAWAQSVSIGESVVPLAPGITVRIVREGPRIVNGADQCGSDFPTAWGCPGSPAFPPSWGIHGAFTIGFDAVGNAYHVTGDGTTILRQVSPAGVVEDVARLISIVGNTEFQPQGAIVDVTNGRIWILTMSYYLGPSGKTPGTVGTVEISGLPTLFDTVLTFVPPGQSLSAVVPTHPDGFLAADSLQLWTGDLGTLPDWSQAESLACTADTNPAPGQVVTVADTLPDPAWGQGRYYIAASQHGTDRRLGRQYVNGAFSARDPGALPVCQ